MEGTSHVRYATGVDGTVLSYYFVVKNNDKLLSSKNDFRPTPMTILRFLRTKQSVGYALANLPGQNGLWMGKFFLHSATTNLNLKTPSINRKL